MLADDGWLLLLLLRCCCCCGRGLLSTNRPRVYNFCFFFSCFVVLRVVSRGSYPLTQLSRYVADNPDLMAEYTKWTLEEGHTEKRKVNRGPPSSPDGGLLLKRARRLSGASKQELPALKYVWPYMQDEHGWAYVRGRRTWHVFCEGVDPISQEEVK